jgi:hypothetical protein
LLVWAGGACWRIVLLVFLEELVGVWWTVTGEHLLLGVLGSGARNPYGILELGSQRGFVPSWLGGKDSVFRQFSSSLQQQERKGQTSSSRGILPVLILLILLRMKVMICIYVLKMCNMLCNLFMIILDCII